MPKPKKILLSTAILLGGLTILFFSLPDYSRRALIYLNPDTDDYRIFPNNVVRSEHPVPWPVSVSFNKHEPGKAYLDSLLHYDPLVFLIIRQDSVWYEQYFNRHTPQSISNTFSTTKTIVSMLIGCAIRDGFIQSTADPVVKYLPGAFKHPIDTTMTIEHLLRMSSGFDYDEAYASPFSATTRSYYGRDLAGQMRALKQREAPGKIYDYIGANTQVLGMILTKVTGKSLATYASEKLWGPVGAEHDALWSKDRDDGMEKAYCCFTATARDLARFGKLICDSGMWNGQEILPQDYFLEMTRPSSGLSDEGNPADFYGLHIWLTQWEGLDVIYARGIKGQYIIVIPSKDLIIVRLGEKRSEQYTGRHTNDLFFYLRLAFRMTGDTI
jgi:CubicO group peptidase (beta-lactamase class C family)